MSIKRCSAILLLLAFALGGAGCLGAVSLEEFKYVAAIGLDKGDQMLYEYTFLLQSENTSHSQAVTGAAIVLSAEGDTIFEAMNTVHASVAYRLSFERNNSILFSRELAQAEGLEQLTKLAFNAWNMRPSVKVGVVVPSAHDYLQAMAGSGKEDLAELQYNLFQNYSADGITPIIDYDLLYEAVTGGVLDPVMMLGGLDTSAVELAKEDQARLSTVEGSSGGSQPAPEEPQENGRAGEAEQEEEKKEEAEAEKPRTTTDGVLREGGMAATAIGAALFDGWTMAGALDELQTKYMLMGRGEFAHGWIKFMYEGDIVVIHCNSIRRRVKMTRLGDAPHARMELDFTCEILQDNGPEREDNWSRYLQKAAQAHMEAELQRVFKDCQSLNCDAMGMGQAAVKWFSGTADWEAYKWKEKYPAMTAEFEVHLLLTNKYITLRME
ncbi:MAG: Ger(x)C family spore germination C-terminal domain-containing protein [Christensenellaceae bacterium]|jgi:hypothetical protein|nr:Ger(x)C family spore germination C-terminal domain-containing protein [Christensenellaceae bacterium]